MVTSKWLGQYQRKESRSLYFTEHCIWTSSINWVLIPNDSPYLQLISRPCERCQWVVEITECKSGLTTIEYMVERMRSC